MDPSRPDLSDLADLAELDPEPSLTPGFDQIEAYRSARKVGVRQDLEAVRHQIAQKRERQRELLEFAGPAGSQGACDIDAEIASLEAEAGRLEEVLRGERLPDSEVVRLSRVKAGPRNLERPSGLADV